MIVPAQAAQQAGALRGRRRKQLLQDLIRSGAAHDETSTVDGLVLSDKSRRQSGDGLLKSQLQSQLNDAPGAGCGDAAKEGARNVACGIQILGAIEGVEEIGP